MFTFNQVFFISSRLENSTQNSQKHDLFLNGFEFE